MKLLENRVCIVTGGSRGIGEAVVRKFVQEGATVIFTYRSSSTRADEIVKELNSDQTPVRAYRSDASKYEDAEQLVKKVLDEFEAIDVLVNNAGITRDNLVLRMTPEQWSEVIQTNLDSVFNMTKLVTKPMMKQRAGSIINVSSIVGVGGHAGQSNYAASKAGVIAFTQSIADELGSRNIRCNAIAPGFIETDMTASLPEAVQKEYLNMIAMNRFGRAEEVANTALFLASDLSSYVSKQTIRVCGAHKR